MTNWSCNSSSPYRLSRRLQTYALATGALMGISGAAQAGVIHTVVNQTVTSKDNPSGDFLTFDFDGDAQPDLVIAAFDDSTISGQYFALTFLPASGGTFITDVDQLLISLPAGSTLLDAAIAYPPTGIPAGILRARKAGFEAGQWANDLTKPGYFGFSFKGASSQLHAGWMQAAVEHSAVDGTTIKVIDYGWEQDPNTNITIGAVPEPSSIALMATGAAGLLALRRRRAAR